MRPQHTALLVLVATQLLAANLLAQGSTETIIDDENYFSVFVGAVTPVEATDLTSFSVGAEYEMRFTPHWGAAGLITIVAGDHPRRAQLAVGGVYRPVPALRLSLWPGIELVETERADGSKVRKGYALLSLGVSYAVLHKGVSLAPVLYANFFGETDTNLTYGIAIGNGF